MDLTIMKLHTVIVILVSLTCLCEGKPVYASPRWFDYDYFPVAKPIQDEGSGHVVGTVNPLRPYEPWILDCILFSSDKIEAGTRHERCQDMDEHNEKEYGKFLFHVAQWEEAYPERATRWNSRFPDAKENEKKKYEQLKSFAEMHKKNLPAETSDVTTSTQRAECPTSCKPENNAKAVDIQDEPYPAKDDHEGDALYTDDTDTDTAED